jgi:hypothetical protein
MKRTGLWVVATIASLLFCMPWARAGSSLASPPSAGSPLVQHGPNLGPRPWVPEADTKAFWVESTVCTVVVKTPIDAVRPIQAGTPIDLLTSLPAICTSSVTGQNQVQGGIRSLLTAGFRVTGVSHQVAVLSPAGGDGKAELLISAILSLERQQLVAPGGR